MKTRLLNILEKLHTSYWFIPSLMILAAIGLSTGMIVVDREVDLKDLQLLPWGVEVSPAGARMIFSTVAGSMITVAGVVFSIMIVALSLATTQFGPRLLRSFMRDRATQIVLGTFLATFVYCLLLLRTTHGENGGEAFVPHAGLAVGMLLTLFSVGVFVYFIHHAADAIQAPTVAGVVAAELDAAIEKLFPEKIGHEESASPRDAALPARFESEAQSVRAARSGYLQAVDGGGLLEVARKHDVVIQICVRPGDFVVAGNELTRCWPMPDEPGFDKQITGRFFIGRYRTTEQDAQFPVQQLVDMALRALSPSLNDPHTAITCINHLGAALCALAERTMPSPWRYDEEHCLRVLARPLTFACIAEAAFRPLREHGTGDSSFAEALFQNLLHVARRVRRAEDAEAIKLHAREALAEVRRKLSQARDVERLTEIHGEIVRALDRTSPPRAESTAAVAAV